MVKIPTATRPPEPAPLAGPPPPPSPEPKADDSPGAEDVVQRGAEDSETTVVIASPDVTDQALTGTETDDALPAAPDGAAASVTRSPSDEATPPEALEPPPGAAPAPPVDDRQPFRVVITAKPARDDRWTAFIAVGRIDALGKPSPVDPVFETLACDGLADALDAVAGVYAAADARWTEQPRNAPVPRTTPARRERAPRAPATDDAARQRQEVHATGVAQQPKPAANANPAAPPPPAIGEKLSLF